MKSFGEKNKHKSFFNFLCQNMHFLKYPANLMMCFVLSLSFPFFMPLISVQTILNLLTDDDQLMLLTVSSNVHTMNDANKFYAMNSTNKMQLRKYIDALDKDMAVTNHSLAFQYTFDWIKSQFDSGILLAHSKSTPLQILYVSRGLITSLSETKIVLGVIAAGQKRLKQPVVINTCAIVLGEFFELILLFYSSLPFFLKISTIFQSIFRTSIFDRLVE